MSVCCSQANCVLIAALPAKQLLAPGFAETASPASSVKKQHRIWAAVLAWPYSEDKPASLASGKEGLNAAMMTHA